MTQNQINFAKLREDIRHNQVTEGYSAIELAESQRHNTATEGLSARTATESERHNRESEGLNWYIAPYQAQNYMSNATYNYERAKFVEEEHVLARDKFEEDVYVNRENLINEFTRIQNDSRSIDIAYQRMMNDLDNFLLQYNFDLAKYQESGYYRDMAAAVRDFTQGGRNAVGVVSDIISIVGNSLKLANFNK